MTEADGPPVGNEDFNGAVLRNIYEVFLEPEVVAREGGRSSDRSERRSCCLSLGPASGCCPTTPK